MLIKAASLNPLAKDFASALKWSFLAKKEFQEQARLEHEHGYEPTAHLQFLLQLILPVAFIESEISVTQCIVYNFWKNFAECLEDPEIEKVTATLKKNLQVWKQFQSYFTAEEEQQTGLWAGASLEQLYAEVER